MEQGLDLPTAKEVSKAASLQEPRVRHFPTSWSSDGEFLLYHVENTPGTGSDQWVLSLRDGTPHLLVGEAFNEWAGVFSPDSRWAAYVSLATGVPQVYVRPFHVSGETGEPSFGQGTRQVSEDIGNWPQWRVDGEIVFNSVPEDWAIFAAPVSTEGTGFESGVPQRLPFPPYVRVGTHATRDGRFLVGQPLEPPEQPAFSVVLNWPALVKR